MFLFYETQDCLQIIASTCNVINWKNCINPFKTCMIGRNNKSQYMVYHAPNFPSLVNIGIAKCRIASNQYNAIIYTLILQYTGENKKKL